MADIRTVLGGLVILRLSYISNNYKAALATPLPPAKAVVDSKVTSMGLISATEIK